jgi:hypothetical protein
MKSTAQHQRLSLKNTGSFINLMMGNNSTLPAVGAGATILLYSDRHAYQVLWVSSDRQACEIARCKAKRTDQNGCSEMQEYDYSELYDWTTTLIWKNDAWRQEIKTIEFVPAYYKLFEQASSGLSGSEYMKVYKEYFASLRDENDQLLFIEGKTKRKTSYSPVNILFRTQEEYYDFTR